MTSTEELERLLAEATPSGDWSVDENTVWSNDRGVPVADVRIGAPTWYKGPKLPYQANAALIVAAVNALPALIARVEELEGALGIIAKGKYGTCPIDGHWPPEKPCTRCGDLGFFDTDPEYDPSRDGHCVEGGARALARAALKGAAQ